MSDDPLSLIKRAMKRLDHDRPRLIKYDQYARGEQDRPYIPHQSTAELQKIADSSITNACQLLVSTPAQGMALDGFRRGEVTDEASVSPDQPEWRHFQRSGWDARQASIYRSAFTFGHAFVVAEADAQGRSKSRGLSALRTTALYDDPASDDNAVIAIHVQRWNKSNGKGGTTPGRIIAWDQYERYEVSFTSLDQIDPQNDEVRILSSVPHDTPGECPVTRFAPVVDMEGRTTGCVEPFIPLQDRLNKQVFDLLVTSTYSSFKVRTVTGMSPPVESVPVWEYPNGDGPDPTINGGKGEVIDYVTKVDSVTGEPVMKNIGISQSRLLFAESPDTQFGYLDETPLAGFIEAIRATYQEIAALSQTPPHYLLGQIANLSADALDAAETTLFRKVAEFQAMFGESWERVFRLAMVIDGEVGPSEDYQGEVKWRDTEMRNMAQIADAYGKYRQMLDIPARGLWPRVAESPQEVKRWEKLREEEDVDLRLQSALSVASGRPRPTLREEPVNGQPTA